MDTKSDSSFKSLCAKDCHPEACFSPKDLEVAFDFSVAFDFAVVVAVFAPVL
jgi:hypothetical protein